MLKLDIEALKDSPKFGVTVLFTKHIKNIVRITKILRRNERKVENLRAAKDLARDTGNTKKKENTAAQNIYPLFE